MALAEAPMAVLATALRDPSLVARYQAKIVTVPGSDCRWWQGAVSGRGARPVLRREPGGRLEGGERDVCVIAHRFGYALVYRAAALNLVPVRATHVTIRLQLQARNRSWRAARP